VHLGNGGQPVSLLRLRIYSYDDKSLRVCRHISSDNGDYVVNSANARDAPTSMTMTMIRSQARDRKAEGVLAAELTAS
jgi:hypothetical protein